MGWSSGIGEGGKLIGYSVTAECDHPDCDTQIDRGLGFACGDVHGGGSSFCAGYFCADHLFYSAKSGVFVCEVCLEETD